MFYFSRVYYINDKFMKQSILYLNSHVSHIIDMIIKKIYHLLNYTLITSIEIRV